MSNQVLVTENEIDCQIEEINNLAHLFANTYTREEVKQHLLWIKEDQLKGKGLGAEKGFTSATFYRIGSQSALGELKKHLASK